jgi:hypothetical protein
MKTPRRLRPALTGLFTSFFFGECSLSDQARLDTMQEVPYRESSQPMPQLPGVIPRPNHGDPTEIHLRHHAPHPLQQPP